MIKVILNGTTKRWGEDWRVLEVSDTNGSLPVYVLEKNQGEHDQRFFTVKLSVDKNYILEKARLLFAAH